MTTIIEEEETCFICGEKGTYLGLGSTNRFGPPEMMRSTMRMWIRRCTTCGYCAPQLSKGSTIATQIVNSTAYLQQKDDQEYPELANKFLCWALIQEAMDNYSQAGWAAVRAAWACDDEETAVEKAKQCRLKAIDYFNEI